MRIVLFYHSLISDWNHGTAHFLRGIASELLFRGHNVTIYEPRNSWSVQNLIQERRAEGILGYRSAYPGLTSVRYDLPSFNLSGALRGADLVIVHDWNDHDLVTLLGSHRYVVGGYTLLFHDTHHRSVTNTGSMAAYDLSGYDGVLAVGNVIRDLYLTEGRVRRAWTWHEAADVRVFHPQPTEPKSGDVVWIGSWGDEKRTAELFEYLVSPIADLGLEARVYGARYPAYAKKSLADAEIEYAGWLPNYQLPEVFGSFRATVHIPRRPYVESLPGIPTIHPFEALACGIPLVSGLWDDCEHLFTPGQDFLMVHNGAEMRDALKSVLNDPVLASGLAESGLKTILNRHTCAHRVDELMEIYSSLTHETSPDQ